MNEIKQAIIEANRLGFKGLKVVDYLEPQSATDAPRLTLIVTLPKEKTGSDSDD